MSTDQDAMEPGREQVDQENDFWDVRGICGGHRIEIREIKPVTGSFGKRLFIINQEYLLRVSGKPMLVEQEKFRRVAGLDYVPKMVHTGALKREVGPLYYILLTLLPGDDFVNVYPETTQAQQIQLGRKTAGFLDRLHEISGTSYDIGLYVPAFPQFYGTWREGHQRYWDRLREEARSLSLQPGSREVFERAFRFLEASSADLDYQAGPKLLHNDFHPKNILLDRGEFSGVIDWECSQFGEPDFELCHLIHWCLYPPEPGIDFRPFLRAFFEASPECARVPRLARRLTVYQLEHEIQQIIWNAREAERWRVPRLIRWMEGGVEDLFRETALGNSGWLAEDGF